MRIAFTAKGDNWDSMIDERFGRTKNLLVYDDEKDELEHFDNSAIDGVAHGAGPQTAQKLFELKPDVLITGNGPGGNAASVLASANIRIFVKTDQMTVKEAYDA